MKIYVHTKICTQIFIIFFIMAKLERLQLSFNGWMDKQTVIYPNNAIIKRNKLSMQWLSWTSKALCWVIETSLKSLYIIWYHSSNILTKKKLQGWRTDQSLPGVKSREMGMTTKGRDKGVLRMMETYRALIVLVAIQVYLCQNLYLDTPKEPILH